MKWQKPNKIAREKKHTAKVHNFKFEKTKKPQKMCLCSHLSFCPSPTKGSHLHKNGVQLYIVQEAAGLERKGRGAEECPDPCPKRFTGRGGRGSMTEAASGGHETVRESGWGGGGRGASQASLSRRRQTRSERSGWPHRPYRNMFCGVWRTITFCACSADPAWRDLGRN